MLLGHSAANTSAARMTIGHSAGSTSGVVMHIGDSAAYTLVVRMRGGRLCGQHVCGENAGRPIRGQLVRSEHADRPERPASCFFFCLRQSGRPVLCPDDRAVGPSQESPTRAGLVRGSYDGRLRILNCSSSFSLAASAYAAVVFLSRPNATFDRHAVPSQ